MHLNRFAKNRLHRKKNHDHFGHFFDSLYLYFCDFQALSEHFLGISSDSFLDQHKRHNLVDEMDSDYDLDEVDLVQDDEWAVALVDFDEAAVDEVVQVTNFFKFVAIFVHFSMVQYFSAAVAQQVERFHGKEEVTGSIPVGGYVF